MLHTLCCSASAGQHCLAKHAQSQEVANSQPVATCGTETKAEGAISAGGQQAMLSRACQAGGLPAGERALVGLRQLQVAAGDGPLQALA